MPGRTVQAISLDHHLIIVSHVGPNPDPLLGGLDNLPAERAAMESSVSVDVSRRLRSGAVLIA
mgnify:CR=1 FL=1